MDIFLLFSGGKDSSLSAILLEPFFDVTLVTGNFGFSDTWKFARDVASELGFPHKVLRIDGAVLETACDLAVGDGYPNRAINRIHLCALQSAAVTMPATVASAGMRSFIADGTRRDDRVPMLELPDAQRLEDTYKCVYVRPLLGYGRHAVNLLVGTHLEIAEDESEKIEKSDYEAELRAIIEERHGFGMVDEIFPRHVQSRVVRRKDYGMPANR